MNKFEQFDSPEVKLALFRDEVESLKMEEDFEETAKGKRKTAHFQGVFNRDNLDQNDLALWDGFKAVMAEARDLDSFLPELNAYRDGLRDSTDDNQTKKSKAMILSYLTNRLAEKQLLSELKDLKK